MKKFLSILLALLLIASTAALAEGPASLSGDAYYAANLFLSNFSEVGTFSCGDCYLSYIHSWASHENALIDFAIDHMWFNNRSQYEWGDYTIDGESYNCRVSDAKIQYYIDSYFYDMYEMDHEQTRYTYKDGWYYTEETGGHTTNGFTLVTGMLPLGDDTYCFTFGVFAGGNSWDSTALSLSWSEACARYGEPSSLGCARVHATDIRDRSTYRLISYGAA